MALVSLHGDYINVRVKYNGGLLPDIVLLILRYYIGQPFDSMKSFCPYSQCSHLNLDKISHKNVLAGCFSNSTPVVSAPRCWLPILILMQCVYCVLCLFFILTDRDSTTPSKIILQYGGAGGRRSLVLRSLSVILTLQPKFLNRVMSYMDLQGLRSFRVCSRPGR